MKGHKLKRSWTGAQSGYATGRCECGHWSYRGWTTKMRAVIRSHRGHVARLAEGKGVPGFDLPKEEAVS